MDSDSDEEDHPYEFTPIAFTSPVEIRHIETFEPHKEHVLSKDEKREILSNVKAAIERKAKEYEEKKSTMGSVLKSKRRGALSWDEEALERRAWYANLQSAWEKRGPKSTNELLEDEEITENADDSFTASKSVEDDIEENEIPEKTAAKEVEEDEQSEAPAEFVEFQSMSLAIADESLNRQEKEIAIIELPFIPPYKIPKRFEPTRWLQLMNNVKTAAVTKKSRIENMSSEPSALPIVICFHGLAGNPFNFKYTAAVLEKYGIQVYAVCLPGRSNRIMEEPVDSVHNAAGAIVDSMKALGIINDYVNGTPYGTPVTEVVLLGHCVGGLIAFEVCRIIESQYLDAVSVKMLFLSSVLSPETMNENYQDRYFTKLTELSEKELMKKLVQFMGIRKDNPVCLLSHRLEIDSYWEGSVFGRRVSCPITTFSAGESKFVPQKSVDSWCDFSTTKGEAVYYHGAEHTYLQQESLEEMMIDMLRRTCLNTSCDATDGDENS